MSLHVITRVLFALVFACGIVSSHKSVIAAEPDTPSLNQIEPNIKTMIGKPVVAGNFLFWRDTRNPHPSIYGYDFGNGMEFLVSDTPSEKFDFASDGSTLAWVERLPAVNEAPSNIRIQGFDLATRTEFTILTFPDINTFSSIALDNNILYHTGSVSGNPGLYARDLATGQEQLITPNGQDAVVADGIILWTEEESIEKYVPAKVSLHMRKLDGSLETVLGSANAGYGGVTYAVSGDHVVWSFAPASGDARAYLHRVSTAITQVLSTAPVESLTINGNSVVWSTLAPNEFDAPYVWSVQRYDLASGSISNVITNSSTSVFPLGFINQDTLVMTADRHIGHIEKQLYTADVNSYDLRLPEIEQDAVEAPDVMTPDAAVAAACTTPKTCGQVYVGPSETTWFKDSRGIWRVKGVQFFLPKFGINDKTFHNGNYNASVADGSLDFWLNTASDRLGANMLRIFVELPSKRSDGTIRTPTSVTTVYDFATRANAHGMRLGISLHNSADWSMTSERRAWIAGLIKYFKDRQALPIIAYLNADNEINNHCSGGKDCFDGEQSYINGAISWVSNFYSVVKLADPSLLVTVGMSSEMTDGDGTRAAFNYYKKTNSSGIALVDKVDFLSPHNYGGGAVGILNDLRFNGYTKPVLLEEYGYPTDPYKPSQNYYLEGGPQCYEQREFFARPPACNFSGTYFVHENLHGVRVTSYAGASAWMLADVKEKDTSDACTKKPSDLWTGLFSIGGTYCGGTFRTTGQEKTTGRQVILHHRSY